LSLRLIDGKTRYHDWNPESLTVKEIDNAGGFVYYLCAFLLS